MQFCPLLHKIFRDMYTGGLPVDRFTNKDSEISECLRWFQGSSSLKIMNIGPSQGGNEKELVYG